MKTSFKSVPEGNLASEWEQDCSQIQNYLRELDLESLEFNIDPFCEDDWRRLFSPDTHSQNAQDSVEQSHENLSTAIVETNSANSLIENEIKTKN